MVRSVHFLFTKTFLLCGKEADLSRILFENMQEKPTPKDGGNSPPDCCIWLVLVLFCQWTTKKIILEVLCMNLNSRNTMKSLLTQGWNLLTLMKSSALPQMKLNPPICRRGRFRPRRGFHRRRRFRPPIRVDLIEKPTSRNLSVFLVETTGLEPVTSCVWSMRSNQLSYASILEQVVL